MQYKIEGLGGRCVELEDELAEQYLKIEDRICEEDFIITVIRSFGHAPTRKELPDQELSAICNEVLLSQLELFALLPKAIDYVDNHMEQFRQNAEQGILMEQPIEQSSERRTG